MRHVPRELETQVVRAVRSFPALVLTGPRRAGKTWILKRMFPGASYRLLEDPDVVARLRADPQGFLDSLDTPAILDEVQNAPELFAYVRSRIDRNPRRMGRYILTGSQDAPLMAEVTESMAGRAAVLHLLPMSVRETPKVTLLRGGFPEALARPREAGLWFASYLQTYLERDVRKATGIRDLATFRRFLGVIAARHGQLLNKTDIAAPLGVSVPTISHWLSVLELTAQILVVPPYFENFGKRLLKSPKVYVADSGLACHLLGIESPSELRRSPFLGVLFEGFIASEIVKAQGNTGRRREIYFFRDEQGLEVDFVTISRGGGLSLLECKATSTVTPDMSASLRRLAEAVKLKKPRGTRVRMSVVYEPPKSGAPTRALAPGVTAVPWRDFVDELG